MKKLCFIFSLAVCFQLQAQVNSYFNNNPVWTVQSDCGIPAPCIQTKLYNYLVTGDTIINIFSYKQVFAKGMVTNSWMAPPPNPGCSGGYWFIDTVPSFFLRSVGKQIYIRNFQGDTTENLLYDFNLNVGDTLAITANNLSNDVVVDSIDSLNTPNGYLKRFFISGTTWATYIIEGIGASTGLIEPMGPMFECGYNLMCYGLNDTAYFPNTGPTCNMNVSIEDWAISNEMKIYPNPISDECMVLLSYELKDGTLSIVDLNGRVVKNKVHLSGGQVLIKREDIPNGMYWVRLQENDLVWVQKIIFN